MRAKSRAIVRGASVVGRIASFIALRAGSEARMALLGKPRPGCQQLRAAANARSAGSLLRYLGFSCRFQGAELLDSLPGGALIVANHLSFWDAVMLSSRFSCLFVTSVEVREMPVIGWIARLGGCVFVERRDRAGIDGEIAALVSELRVGRKVVLFPEGTSGDGSSVLPFKRSLFRAAVLAGCPVVPVCINYRRIDGAAIDEQSREWLFYYGDHGFFDQLAHVFALRSVEVELDVLEPLLPSPQPSPAPDEHRALCERSFVGIRSRFDPVRQSASAAGGASA